MNASVALEEPRLVGAYTLDGDMTTEVDDCARRVQDHVIGVQARIICFEENLVVHARRGAEKDLEKKKGVCVERVEGALAGLILRDD